MNHFVFSASLLSIASVLTSILAVLHRFPSRIHKIFALYWFSIGFWAFFVGWQSYLIPVLSEFWWGWLLHLGCILIPTLLLHFSFEFTREVRRKKIVLGFSYGVSATYLLLNLFTTLFTSGTAYRDMYAYPIPSFFYPMYFLTFVLSITYGTFLFIRTKSRSRKIFGNRNLRNYLIAQALGYIGGMDNFAIMADIRIFPLYPYGLYLAVLYAGVALSGRVKTLIPRRPRSLTVPASRSISPTSLP